MATSRVKLGSQGLEVSKLGFGCMELSGVYNSPVSDGVGISIINHAFDNGITFLTPRICTDLIPMRFWLARELGIGIVAYSPLGRGFFGGRGVVEEVKDVSYLTNHPRFVGENLEKNKHLFFQLESLAKKHKCTTAQLALAWVLQQGDDVVPIPDEDIKELTDLVNADDVAGDRTYSGYEHTSWKYANTPHLNL
ncbi:perakine reductase-like protein [Carex littledalei]|uniref:Perakine reductase-like protein n=1 Tax=Carex littledalei TaxID=544730 RepID=A0A833RJ16_9POAL|nr:perakine reductase-like protein [Carex littledalei]